MLNYKGDPQVPQGNLLSLGLQWQTHFQEQQQQLQQQQQKPLMPYVGMQPFPNVVPPGESIPVRVNYLLCSYGLIYKRCIRDSRKIQITLIIIVQENIIGIHTV